MRREGDFVNSCGCDDNDDGGRICSAARASWRCRYEVRMLRAMTRISKDRFARMSRSRIRSISSGEDKFVKFTASLSVVAAV
jgi:hypothetical protein